jgi:bifunctional UDP-N-acetylglucosamine pyrophosphorylase / glucosamine-1-phosphate N-acetyltransferase
MLQDVSVVILAAGQGTRMKSRIAKVLHGAGGKPLIEHALDAAFGIAPASRVFVVVGHQAEAVREVVERRGARVVLQAEQLGTGHAVLCGESGLAGLGGRLVVFYGDCPLIRTSTLENLLDLETRSGSSCAMVTTDLEDPTGYGRVLRDASGDVSAIVEHKAATPTQLAVREINAGVYSFDAAAFWKHIHDVRPDNAAREYYLTDIIEIFIRSGLRVSALKIADASELLGINNRIELAEADRILRLRKARELMLDGVTIERPETVTIDAEARIGMDTIISAYTRITGATIIGENCRIGTGCVIESCKVGDGVEVHPFSVLTESTLDARAQVGPFTRFRAGAHAETGAHVGNFVELKKTRLGAGSKAMHLAYLGDSNVGAKVNVGAGTITCNYDGEKKWPTRIGDGAFVGSNSTLVAPVEIAGGAYIGAGSVITDNVPAEALALGRARQVVKEGWKKRRKSQASSGAPVAPERA